MNDAPYKKLLVWKYLCELRREIFLETEMFKMGNLRTVEQMRAAARSAKQNFAEGYRKENIGQFMNFCNISRASLEELSEDINDCHEDKLLSQEAFSKLSNLCNKSMYFLDRYILSLNKMKTEKRWRARNKC